VYIGLFPILFLTMKVASKGGPTHANARVDKARRADESSTLQDLHIHQKCNADASVLAQ
jgi:hypothetical protein